MQKRNAGTDCNTCCPLTFLLLKCYDLKYTSFMENEINGKAVSLSAQDWVEEGQQGWGDVGMCHGNE